MLYSVPSSFCFFFFRLDNDECASSEANQCHLNSLCTNTEGSYVCRCLRGYVGDGLSCAGMLEYLCP